MGIQTEAARAARGAAPPSRQADASPTRPYLASQQVSIDRKEVKSIELSKVSPMPPMLLNMLTQDEILDLVAYVLSGGDKENAWFKK